MWADLNNRHTHVYGLIVRDMVEHLKQNTNWSIIFACIPVKNHLHVHLLVVGKSLLVRKISKSINERILGKLHCNLVLPLLIDVCFIENDHFDVNFVNEVLPIVRIERNINMFIHRINHTIAELVVAIRPILIHHVSHPYFETLLNFDVELFFLALRKHMKMHESQGQDSTSSAATNSSSGSVNDSSLKRNNLHRRAGENDRSPSPRMHHHSQRRRRSSRDSINTHLHLQQQQQQQQQLPNNHSSMNTTTTTDSCSESPPSFENLAPMKAALTRMHHPQVQSGPPATSTDWPLHMHTMSAYHHPHVYHPHHAAALQQHYYHRQTGLNF